MQAVYGYKYIKDKPKSKRAGQAIAGMVAGILVSLLISSPVLADGEIKGSFAVAFEVTQVSVSSINTSGAMISWKTSGAAQSQVFYDTQNVECIDDYSFQSVNNPDYLAEGSIELADLSPSTTYYFRVYSITANNISAFSQEYSFHTDSVSEVISLPIAKNSELSTTSTFTNVSVPSIDHGLITEPELRTMEVIKELIFPVLQVMPWLLFFLW